MSSNDDGVIMQIGFNLVLKKLQQHAYEGAIDNESPSEAFRRHCAMWELSDTGRNMCALAVVACSELHQSSVAGHNMYQRATVNCFGKCPCSYTGSACASVLSMHLHKICSCLAVTGRARCAARRSSTL